MRIAYYIVFIFLILKEYGDKYDVTESLCPLFLRSGPFYIFMEHFACVFSNFLSLFLTFFAEIVFNYFLNDINWLIFHCLFVLSIILFCKIVALYYVQSCCSSVIIQSSFDLYWTGFFSIFFTLPFLIQFYPTLLYLSCFIFPNQNWIIYNSEFYQFLLFSKIYAPLFIEKM